MSILINSQGAEQSYANGSETFSFLNFLVYEYNKHGWVSLVRTFGLHIASFFLRYFYTTSSFAVEEVSSFHMCRVRCGESFSHRWRFCVSLRCRLDNNKTKFTEFSSSKHAFDVSAVGKCCEAMSSEFLENSTVNCVSVCCWYFEKFSDQRQTWTGLLTTCAISSFSSPRWRLPETTTSILCRFLFQMLLGKHVIIISSFLKTHDHLSKWSDRRCFEPSGSHM